MSVAHVNSLRWLQPRELESNIILFGVFVRRALEFCFASVSLRCNRIKCEMSTSVTSGSQVQFLYLLNALIATAFQETIALRQKLTENVFPTVYNIRITCERRAVPRLSNRFCVVVGYDSICESNEH